MSPHQCTRDADFNALDAASVRHTKELYEGREGRQPIIVRLDRCERVIDKLVYVSTTLLVAMLLGAGTVIWQTVTASVRNHPANSALIKN